MKRKIIVASMFLALCAMVYQPKPQDNLSEVNNQPTEINLQQIEPVKKITLASDMQTESVSTEAVEITPIVTEPVAVTAPVETQTNKPVSIESTGPVGGAVRANGDVWIPGFGYIKDSGATNIVQSQTDGDWNKIIGE